MTGRVPVPVSGCRGGPSGPPTFDVPMRARSDSYGATRPTCPRSASARHSSSVCQPVRALRMTTFIGAYEAGAAAPSVPVQRRAQDFGIDAARVEGASSDRAGDPHLGRAEQHRVDLIEVVVVALEDVVERRAVV